MAKILKKMRLKIMTQKTKTPRKPVDKTFCPLCGEKNRMYFGHNLWCVHCDELKIKRFSLEKLRVNKRKIELGLIKVGKG